MRASLLAAPLVLLAAAACGDDTPSNDADAQVSTCRPPPSAALPASGELISPDELPLPGSCVLGGMRDVPGRWFIADLTSLFNFAYPKFEGTCESGFRTTLGRPDDLDPSDGRAFQTWNDGTVHFQRSYFRFDFPMGGVYEYVSAMALCMTPEGTLATAFATHSTDLGRRSSTGTGTRFGLKDAPASGLERLGSVATWGDARHITGFNVWVDGTVAYVVGPEGLDLIDVTDPAAPAHVGHLGGLEEGPDGFNDVRVVRGNGRVIAFASAYRSETTYVIDVTDPTQPAFLADIPEYSHSVQLRRDGDRTLLYLATYTNAVPVYDVTDPTQPVRLGAPTVSDPEEDAGIHDLTVDGDVLYVNNTTDGLVVIDISAGLDAPAVERFRVPTTYSHASWVATVGGRKIVIHGDEGMTPEGGAFMRIIDADPASPTFGEELARYRTRPEVGIHNMEIVGDKAYVSYYQDGVRIVDLSDPTMPREVAHYNTWDDATATGAAFEGAVGARPYGGLVYVADAAQGLIILRETPP